MSAVLHHAPVSGSAKLVLIGLANHAGHNGTAYPAIATLCRYANVDRRSVQRALRQLEDLKLITSDQRDGTSTLYRLNVECPPNCDRTTAHKLGGVTEDRGDTSAAPRGDTSAAGGVTPAPPEPSMNRQLNQNNDSAERFALFWDKYPRKIAKQAAQKAFTPMTLEQQQLAVTAAAAYALSELPNDDKFIPHAATWLRQGRYMDSFKPAPATAQRNREQADKQRRAAEHARWLAEQEAARAAAAPAPKCLHNSSVSFLQCKHKDCLQAVANNSKGNN